MKDNETKIARTKKKKMVELRSKVNAIKVFLRQKKRWKPKGLKVVQLKD